MSFLRDLVDEINKVRANPSSYVEKIADCKNYFNGKILKMPDSTVGIKTQEGADAYDECIQFLRSAEPAEETVPSKGLTKIANELLAVVQKDASQIGSVDMNELIERYGSFSGAFNRVMECGGSTPQQVVINLLVSDGDKSRSQRNVLLNKAVKRIGVASGKHDIYRNASIIIFCTKFDNSVESDDYENYCGGTSSSYQPPKREAPKPVQQPRPQPQYQPQPKYQPEPKPAPKPVSNPDSSLPLLKQKIVEKPASSSAPQEDENVVSVDKAERVVVEGGKRKKKITYTKHYKDGHTEKEVKFENL
jgi:hypothetical protein